MSLAAVQIPAADFLLIQQHMASRPRVYRNMHLRQARQQNGRRVLRYLHALYTPNATEIEGAMSGPGTFWHYRIALVSGQPQIQVLSQRSTPAEAKRIQKRFLGEILKRVREEQKGNTHAPRYLTGQIYLKRRLPGMAATHANCQYAVSSLQLDAHFVTKLQGWNLMILRK